MNRLRFYLRAICIHAQYGSWQQALSYAWRHRCFWHGAEDDHRPYVHIGSRQQ